MTHFDCCNMYGDNNVFSRESHCLFIIAVLMEPMASDHLNFTRTLKTQDTDIPQCPQTSSYTTKALGSLFFLLTIECDKIY